LAGQRVLVVGAGNSGCDIAVEAAQHEAQVSISMRRGYHFVPKYVFGRPSDRMIDKGARLHIPWRMRRWLAEVLIYIQHGDPARAGLPKPDHRLYETHPIVNSLLPYFVAHGAITCRPNIERFDGSTVHFNDGSSAEFDTIVFATGYRLTFPFIDLHHLNWHEGRPNLLASVFHPESDSLFVAGMIQPDSGQFGLVRLQAVAISRFLAAERAGSPIAERFKAMKRDLSREQKGRRGYAATSRHALEVEHWGYMLRLKKICRMLDGAAPAGAKAQSAGRTPSGAVAAADPA